MERKAVSGIMLTLLMLSILTLAFTIQPAKAESPTIYVFEVMQCGEIFDVVVESNSTVSDFYFSQSMREIGFNVTGPDDTIGFSNVSISKALLYGTTWLILIDAEPVTFTVTENATHTRSYFTYTHNTNEVRIIRPWDVAPRTWTVDDDGPADFHKIQCAINAASPGDTIFVHSGTYYENVVVNKTVSLVGENRSTTVIDAKGKGTVVIVTADAVNIQDFTIQNSGIRLGDSGMVLSKSMSSIVEGNIISNNGLGIYIGLSNNNTIYHNVLVNNWEGMRFYLSRLNIVNGNVITNNHYGIHLVDSGDNVLRNNSMVENVYNFGVAGDELPHFINDIDASNTVDGKAIYYLINKQHLVVKPSAFPDAGYLAVINSTRITVQDFGFFNNFQGVLFAYTNNSKIENVNISDNFHGIMLFGSNNTLKGNNLTKNGYAIHSYGHSNLYFENVIADNNDGFWLIGSNNSIRRNAITNNNYRGIYLIGSNNTVFQNEIMNNSVGIVIDFYDNKIYHNSFINNVKQADLNEPRAIGIWDGDYPSGGNYWSDFSGLDLYSGPYQNETGSDGIGDTPYVIDENNQDNYPLMNPRTSSPPIPPPPPTIATVDVNPDTLNLKSKGRWITAHIELPEGYNISNIDGSTILLNDTIPVDSFWLDKPLESVIGDYDNDGITDLMVKFDRQALIEYLKTKGTTDAEVTIAITGEANGKSFEVTDTIKVIDQ